MSSKKDCLHPSRLIAGVLFTLLLTTPALAAEAHKGPSEANFLLQIVILVVVGRLFGELMVRIGQPSIMGQIIGGILLGPSVLGLAWPDIQTAIFPHDPAQKAMTDAIGQIGILFLLLLAGMETDLGLALRLRKAAASVSLTGIAIPFAAGFALGEMIPQAYLPDPDKRLVTALFLGTALSISSVKIVASVVREMDFMRRNIGQLIVASAIIDDTVGWIIIAITFSLAAKGSVDVLTLSTSVIGTLAFMAFSFTLGRRIVFEVIRITNDRFKSDLPVLSAIIGIMGGMAMLTDLIGVHTELGAFVAGILIGESPILTRQIDVQLRALTTALFMPVFFGLTGLQTNLTVLGDPHTLLLAAGLIVIASIGKFGGAFAAARLGGFSNAEAIALGSGMNARGSTEVIVATIGLSVGVLDQRLFSVIVAMAVVTTMAMPPSLRWALARLPMKEEERDRLEREKFKEQSFVAQLERMLLAVDRSESGTLAARLAGLFAVARSMPVTVLDVEASAPDGKTPVPVNGEAKAANPADTVAAAASSARKSGAGEEEKEEAVHLTIREQKGDLAELVGEGSEQGHDIMLCGVEPLLDGEGALNGTLSDMAHAFKGATAVVASRGRGAPEGTKLSILVPVSGTERATKAAEFAFTIASATKSEVAVLYITEPRQARSLPRVSDTANAHVDIFRRIKEVADFYDVKVKTMVQGGDTPELAILRNARQGGYNLLVLGVSRREGDRISYGPIADALLETSDRPLVFVETG